MQTYVSSMNQRLVLYECKDLALFGVKRLVSSQPQIGESQLKDFNNKPTF